MGFSPEPGGGSGSISGSSDVSLSSPQTDQVLTYDGGSAKWSNKHFTPNESNVYITTTGAELPPDLPEGTLIARYSPTGPTLPAVAVVGTSISTTGSYTIDITTSSQIPAGNVIAVAINRGISSSGQVAGSAEVTLPSGSAGPWTRASATRSGSHDIALLTARVNTTIPTGTTVTIATPTNGTYRAVAAVMSLDDLSSATPDASSGDSAAGVPHGSSAGNHGSAASLTASTAGTTTVDYTLVLGAFSVGSSGVPSQVAGQAQLTHLTTEAGSADRGMVLCYKLASTAGVQSLTVNYSASGGQAAVVMALPIES